MNPISPIPTNPDLVSVNGDGSRRRSQKPGGGVRTEPIDVHRALPHALDAEQGLLGSMLLAPLEVVGDAVERIDGDHFYQPSHQVIFNLLVEFWNNKTPADLITLTQTLRERKQLDAVGGAAYITSLIDHTPTSANSGYYLEIVKAKYTLRQVISTCTEAAARAYDDDGEVGDLLDQVESKVLAISQARTSSAVVPMKDQVVLAIETIEQLYNRRGSITGLSTGFKELDRMTNGLNKSEMIVIAARPSMGKAQPLDARVMTPTGYREMGSLRFGHWITDLHGMPQRVIGVYPQGVRPIYRVTFSDGSSTRCCDEHLWLTQTHDERLMAVDQVGQRPEQLVSEEGIWTVRSLGEIRATLCGPDGLPGNHAVPAHSPVEFLSRHEGQPLDSWLLGALLGGGRLAERWVLVPVVGEDVDVYQGLDESLPEGDDIELHCGFRIVRRGSPKEESLTAQAIEKLGLKVACEEKFIPDSYLIASSKNRVRLLRGVMASVGRKEDQETLCDVPGRRFAADLVSLARSLGIVASVQPEAGRYRVRLRCRSDELSGRIFRRRPDLCRRIVSVEPAGEVACQCIRVDSPAHVYLTDDFIPTHNTALAMNIAESVAIDQQKAVAVFSLEMSSQQLVQRLLCSRARVNISKVRDGFLSERDFPNLTNAASKLSEAKMFIDDTSGLSILELRAKARRFKQQHDIELIVIDYLQLLRSASKKAQENRQIEISEISSGLKGLAKELAIPIIVLAQLNRNPEARAGGKPRLSDLRESGSIEQDADVVGLLVRSEYYAEDEEQKEESRGEAELMIAKQRNGPVGEVKLTFLKEFTRFETRAPDANGG